MSTISIENAIVTVTINNVRYVNNYVTNITITDPRETTLAVSPQGGGQGIAYRTNTESSIMLEMIVKDLGYELITLYGSVFHNKTRVDFMIFDSKTQARFDLNDAILRTNPANTTISEGLEAYDIKINASSPPATFKHSLVKPA